MSVHITVNALDIIEEKINLLKEEREDVIHELSVIKRKNFQIRYMEGLRTVSTVILSMTLLSLFMVYSYERAFYHNFFLFLFHVVILFLTVLSAKKKYDEIDESSFIEAIEELDDAIIEKQSEKRDIIAKEDDKLSTKSFEDESKECPMCAELVKSKARICRFCNYSFC